MTTRTWKSSESLALASGTSTSFTDRGTLSLTDAEASSSTWMIIPSCAHGQSTDSTCQSDVRVRHDTAGVTLSRERFSSGTAPSTPNAYQRAFGPPVAVTFGASPGTQNFSVEQAMNQPTFPTSTSTGRIFAIKLTGNDTIASSTGDTNPTDVASTLSTKVTWTAPANGTYDIFATIRVRYNLTSSGSQIPIVRLIDTDGTTVLRKFGGNSSANPLHIYEVRCVTFHVRKTVTSGQTILLRIGATNGSTSQYIFSHAHIIGFDTAGFTATHMAQDNTERIISTANSSTFAARNAASTLAATAASGDFFAFSNININYDTGSTSTGTQMKWTSEGVDPAHRSRGNVGRTSTGNWVAGRVISGYAGGTLDGDIQFATDSGSGATISSFGGACGAWQLTGGTTRTVKSSETLGSSQITALGFVDKTTLSLTSLEAASSTWVFFASQQHTVDTGTGSNNLSDVRFYHDTASTLLTGETRYPNSTTNDVFSMGTVIPVTFGAAPGQQDFSIEHSPYQLTATVYTENVRMFGIKLTGNDTAVSDLTETNPTGTTGSAVANLTTKLTWTAPATATYDIFASMTVRFADVSTSLIPYMGLLDTDGSTLVRFWGDFPNIQPQTNSEYFTVGWHYRKAITSGQTVKLLCGQGSGGSGNANFFYSNAHIIGLDTAGFNSALGVNDDTSQNMVASSTGEDFWTDRPSSDLALANQDAGATYFMFAGANISFQTSAGITARMRVGINGSEIFKSKGFPTGAGACSAVGGIVYATPTFQDFGLDEHFATANGVSFPIDSLGGSAALYKLNDGTSTPPTPPASRSRGPTRRQRKWAYALGIRG